MADKKPTPPTKKSISVSPKNPAKKVVITKTDDAKVTTVEVKAKSPALKQANAVTAKVTAAKKTAAAKKAPAKKTATKATPAPKAPNSINALRAKTRDVIAAGMDL